MTGPQAMMSKAREMMGGEISPEMIDMLVIQLRGALQLAANAPEKVRATGTAFVEALDEWSEEKKAGK